MENNHNQIEVYEYLASELELSKKHQESLERRGLDKDAIESGGYITIPFKRSSIVAKLEKCLPMVDVPGFYKLDGKWMMSGASGMGIPVRDVDGRIVSYKIRSDDPKARAKYTALSSDPKKQDNNRQVYPNGTSVKSRIHFPITGTPQIGGVLRITEGEMKADVATHLGQIYTISLPGVGMWRFVFEVLDLLKPSQVLIAFDSDKSADYSTSMPNAKVGKPVGKELSQCYMAIKEKGFNVKIEHWEGEYGKGIDDVLANGYADKVVCWSDEEAKEFIEEALDDTMPLDWIYVIQTKRFVHATHLVELDKEQFSDKYSPNIKQGKMADAVIKNPAFPKADLPTYEPRKPHIIERNGQKHYNMWRANGIKPVEGDVTPFIEHCEYMIPDDFERNLFLDWMAYNVQHEGEKIMYAILLQGIPGTGKSYFGWVMNQILGRKNISQPTNEALHENYTDWCKNCSMVIIEELMARGRLELMNKLKPMITQPTIYIREMYKAGYEQLNCFNTMMFTNYEDSIIIDKDDRRYGVIYSPAKKRKDSYYEEFWDWSKENIKAIAHFMHTRDLSNFKPQSHAPMTEGKKQLILESMHPLEAWIHEGVMDAEWPFQGDIVAVADLVECAPDHLKKFSNPKSFAKFFKKMDLLNLGQVKSSLFPTGRKRLWAIRRKPMWEKQEPDGIAKIYNKWNAELESAKPNDNPLKEEEPI